MKNIKIILLIFLTELSFCAGIPVVDAAANSQMQTQNLKQIAEWGKEAQRWQETVSHYQKQLQSYADELMSQTGIKSSISSLREFKQLYSDFGRSFQNMQNFSENILKNPESLIEKMGDSYKNYNLFDQCSGISGEQEKKMCKVDMVTYAAQEQSIKTHQASLNKISENIAELDKKLKNSKDIKESQDIANALASEQLKIQMIQASIDSDHKLYELKRRQKAEQARQLQAKKLDSREYVPILR